MNKQDRPTLKAFFSEGKLPTAEHYSILIDSNVNMVEDGFDKTVDDGLKLSSEGTSKTVLSFYEGLSTPVPSWTVEHGETSRGQEPGTLRFKAHMGAQANQIDTDGQKIRSDGFSLTRDGRSGVDVADPSWRLDVNGTVRMAGRIGVTTKEIQHVDADGNWHDITETLTGCNAFEVMAGAGGVPTEGHYAMLHAIAMNAYHPRNPVLNWLFGRRKIRAQTAVYGSYADRIRLRWVAVEGVHNYKLQIKTNAKYPNGDHRIRYYLTRLWFDTTMEGSRTETDRDKGVL